MHMENQQQLPTILSKAINLKRQRNLNTTKTNLPTTRRIWMPRDEFEYHEPDLNTTLRVGITRDGFKYHETDLNTTKLISIPRDGLNTTRRIWIVTIGLKTVKIQSNVLLQPSLYKHLFNLFPFRSIQTREGTIIFHTSQTFPKLFYSHPPSPHIVL